MQPFTTKPKLGKLDQKQSAILECLLSRTPDESLADVAERAGIHRTTLARMMQDRTFLDEYRQAVSDELALARGQARQVIEELTRIAFSDVRKLFDERGNLLDIKSLPNSIASAVSSVEVIQRESKSGEIEYIKRVRLWNKNDALKSLAKYFDLISDKVEISGPGGGPIEINSNVSVDHLPLYVRQLLVLVSNGKELDAGLQAELQAKLGPMFGEFLAERREMITAGNETGTGGAIEISDYSVGENGNSGGSDKPVKKQRSVSSIDLESI